MAEIPFSPPTVLNIVKASLPQGPEAAPPLKSPYDAVAIFTHACMLSVGFRLVGLSEDDNLEAPIEGSNPKPLPQNWNTSPGNYGFRYAHSQSSLQYLIKVNRLGNKAVVMGLGIGDDKTTSFDIVVRDFLSESFYPYSAGDGAAKLEDGFISTSRMQDLANLVKINIVQKLVPGLHKPGYEGGRSVESSTRQETQQPRRRSDEFGQPGFPRPYSGPGFGPQPGRPPIPAGGERPPGFDDEYEILQPPRGSGGYGMGPGGRNPLSIGEDDLNPPGLGRNPPLVGPFFGQGPGWGGPGPSGMHPGPDHPMFGGGGGGIPDPRFPPGARYDPVGPGDAPRGGLRGPRGPGGAGGPQGFGGGPPNPFSSFGGGDFL